jgi:exodeoxyribonuclease VII small subunit
MAEKKFEESLSRLETIVEKLEGEGLSLEESLKVFEEGVRLIKFCSKKLNEAEKKVEILLRDGEENEKVKPFELDETEG